ncbi:ran GTPase-activating protein 1-like [Notolabrus celidotus]|uniref:ran GTPase-activating protein 1-like n=1 Tax=Notolabrus celidotus TaxID=1203425 RepID=UPI00149011F2|nr:ran GTPase-activating protein 1-like [Notolabrus celidotus]
MRVTKHYRNVALAGTTRSTVGTIATQSQKVWNFIIELPEEYGVPDVMVVDDNPDVCAGIPPLQVHEVVQQLLDIDEEADEDTDDSDDSDEESEDSGYDSVFEDEEEEEDDDIRPHAPLDQEFPPVRHASPSVPAGPPVHVGPSAGPPGGLPTPQSPEECAPSTSGLNVFPKRSREESSTEQVSTKRLRTCGEENPEESAPSTSDLNFSTNRRFWHGPFQFTRWTDDSDSD